MPVKKKTVKKPIRKMATKDAIPEIKRRLAAAKKDAKDSSAANKKKDAAGGFKNTSLRKLPTGVFVDRVKDGMKKKVNPKKAK
jgi:hypothetical protein